MIKAIIFDFYGVIYSDELWNYIAEHSDALQSDSDDVNLGHTNWEAFRKTIATKMQMPVQQVEDMFAKSNINRQLIGKIHQLSQRYKIGLLTDANRAHIEPLLNQLGVDTVFDAVAVSSDSGHVKPDPFAYQAVCKKLEVEPEEAVFIDDLNRNVVGAREIGMQAILYKDFNQFSKELEVLLAG